MFLFSIDVLGGNKVWYVYLTHCHNVKRDTITDFMILDSEPLADLLYELRLGCVWFHTLHGSLWAFGSLELPLFAIMSLVKLINCNWNIKYLS